LNNPQNTNCAFTALKESLKSYSPISDDTWLALKTICKFRQINKRHALYLAGEIPRTFSYVFSGLFRSFVTDENGNEYNKIFFDEGTFSGSMTALLSSAPSRFTIESLEASSIIEIDFRGYRELLVEKHDLKLFQIHYLEKNWLLAKEAREVEMVQDDATQRYKRFLTEYPSLEARLPQYLVASHLGITPTQLSRIRKKTPKNQPM
jgi:CRP-like cAMP-binding protein